MIKDLKSLIEKGRSLGWEISTTESCHYKWVHPNGGLFFTASTPSDKRAIKNIENHMKKTYRTQGRGGIR